MTDAAPQEPQVLEIAPSHEPAKEEEPKSRFLNFQSHPVIAVLTVISAIVGLISFPLSIYLYFAAKTYPQLTYYVNPVKATIVRAGEASKLTASFENKPITTDATAAQVAIWNQGNQAIKKDQILKPIVIYTNNNTPILKATVRKSSRDITQLSLNTDDLQKGRVTVFWNILEYNDGGVIQLIYAGNADVQVQVEGIVEGQPQIKLIEFSGKIQSPNEQYEAGRWEYRTVGYILLMLGIGVIVLAAFIRKAKTDYRKSFKSYEAALDDGVEFYSNRIKWATGRIAQTDKFIEDAEKQFEEYQNDYKEFEGLKETEGFKELVEMNTQWITRYKKEKENSKEEIKEYELKKQGAAEEKGRKLENHRKQLKRFDWATIGLSALGFFIILPALYLIFIVQPVGPPFGF